MQKLKYTVDSRQKTEDGIFFALKGAKTDGHLFLQQAKAQGAKKAYVSLDYEGADFGLELLRVLDPLQALQNLAKQRLEKARPFIIGITGSYAKTTTKEALYQAFSSQKKCFRNPLNQNSQVGLPLSILNFYKDEPLVFLEMGIEHAGDMQKLVQIAPPDVAVITRIAEAHLETLKSLENIAHEKGKIVVFPKTKVQFVHCSAIRFYQKSSDWILEQIVYGHDGEPLFEDVHDLIKKMGGVLGVAVESFRLKLPDLRYQKKSYRKGAAILDCYNANPTTMRIFFHADHKMEPNSRKVAIIGQMAGLGEHTDQYHTQLAEDLKDSFDLAFCVGKTLRPVFALWKKLGKHVFWVETVEQLRPLMQKELQPQDFILVKGSNINRLWEVEPWLEQKLHF